MRPTYLASVLVILGATSTTLAQNIQHGLRVPAGFEVTEFADSKLANDIFSMTLDPRGRVVVAGRGYIRILIDDDNDGRADRAIDFAAEPKEGAQGMLWEGDSLFVTGDGGLRRFKVAKDGGRADGPAELIRAMKTGGEHAAHDIKRGPDGWLYVLGGNFTGIDSSYAQTSTTPIKEPVGGCVLRFTPDLKRSEIVADGFRNPYRMDFNTDGELFTFDSDNERCVSLPWYEGTRFYQVIPGGHHGWQAPQRAQFWRTPPYFCDVVGPVADLGRGSPTGIVCYRHRQFPERYRGGMFLLDWTFGKVYFMTLERSGATFKCQKELFLEAVGDNGFAPTDAVVHPATGDLFISIGGRGTRGGVYRVRHPSGMRTNKGLAQLPVQPRSLDWQPELQTKLLEQAGAKEASIRLQALFMMRRHHEHFNLDELGRAVQGNCDDPERYVRMAAADLLKIAHAPALLSEERLDGQLPRAQITCGLAGYEGDPAGTVAHACRLINNNGNDVEVRLAAVRLVQLALGGLAAPKAGGTVWEGYTFRSGKLDMKLVGAAATALRQVLPTGHADLDREVSRTLAAIEDTDPAMVEKAASLLTAQSDPVEDIHYLIVLSRLRGPRSPLVTNRVAEALLALDRKLARRHMNRDWHWPLRIAEMHAELARRDPRLNAALVSAKDFGRPDHALFAACPGFERRRAAEIFLERSEKDDDYPWNPDLVQIVGQLPAERSLPVLRRLWHRYGLEESILQLLARRPEPIDRERFLEGLGFPQLATVQLSLRALESLPPIADGASMLVLVRALCRLPEGREENLVREKLGRYLQRLTGQEQLGSSKQAWTDWLARTYPGLASRLGGSDGVDIAAWNKRLTKLDWSAGDSSRGRAVFAKASCLVCHSGAQALGPDLQGVAGRFSRADVFTAILQPSRDISARYRTTLVATADGKQYQGLVAYEAVDSMILQTGPATTVRIVNNQITSRRVTETSMMPVGLIDNLSDREIADLYAFLKSLGSPTGKRGAEGRR